MTTREPRNVMSALLPQESERRLEAACESPAITTLSERPPGQVSYLILAVHVPAGSRDTPRALTSGFSFIWILRGRSAVERSDVVQPR